MTTHINRRKTVSNKMAPTSLQVFSHNQKKNLFSTLNSQQHCWHLSAARHSKADWSRRKEVCCRSHSATPSQLSLKQCWLCWPPLGRSQSVKLRLLGSKSATGEPNQCCERSSSSHLNRKKEKQTHHKGKWNNITNERNTSHDVTNTIEEICQSVEILQY